MRPVKSLSCHSTGMSTIIQVIRQQKNLFNMTRIWTVLGNLVCIHIHASQWVYRCSSYEKLMLQCWKHIQFHFHPLYKTVLIKNTITRNQHICCSITCAEWFVAYDTVYASWGIFRYRHSSFSSRCSSSIYFVSLFSITCTTTSWA